LQQGISLRRNQSFVGKTLDVLIEGVDAARGIPYGRSYRDAPEIDGVVLIESGEVTLGEITPVRITGALTYDLTGSAIRPLLDWRSRTCSYAPNKKGSSW
jgi:ribosomal protein S12 methylthiotransferase